MGNRALQGMLHREKADQPVNDHDMPNTRKIRGWPVTQPPRAQNGKAPGIDMVTADLFKADLFKADIDYTRSGVNDLIADLLR